MGLLRDKTGAVSEDVRLAIALEKLDGADTIFKTASHRTYLGNNEESDLWYNRGTYPMPTTGVQLEVKSTSVNDDYPVGTGARTVRVSGVDENYNLIEEDMVLDGTNADITDHLFMRVNSMTVTTVGSAKWNAGEIQAIHDGTVISGIDAQEGISAEGFYTVPKGKQLNITGFLYLKAHGSHDAGSAWLLVKDSANAGLKEVARLRANVGETSTSEIHFDPPLVIGPTGFYKIRGKCYGSNLVHHALIQGYLTDVE